MSMQPCCTPATCPRTFTAILLAGLCGLAPALASEPQPPDLNKPVTLDVEARDIREAAVSLSERLSLPVIVRRPADQDPGAAGDGNGEATKAQQLRYTAAPLARVLDEISATFGYSWECIGGIVVFAPAPPDPAAAMGAALSGAARSEPGRAAVADAARALNTLPPGPKQLAELTLPPDAMKVLQGAVGAAFRRSLEKDWLNAQEGLRLFGIASGLKLADFTAGAQVRLRYGPGNTLTSLSLLVPAPDSPGKTVGLAWGWSGPAAGANNARQGGVP